MQVGIKIFEISESLPLLWYKYVIQFPNPQILSPVQSLIFCCLTLPTRLTELVSVIHQPSSNHLPPWKINPSFRLPIYSLAPLLHRAILLSSSFNTISHLGTSSKARNVHTDNIHLHLLWLRLRIRPLRNRFISLSPMHRDPYPPGREHETCSRLAPSSLSPKEISC
jgi:hypothetical protein